MQVWWAGVSGNHEGRDNSIRQVDEDSDMDPDGYTSCVSRGDSERCHIENLPSMQRCA